MAETVDKSGTIGGLLITNADKIGTGIGSIIGAATGHGGGIYYDSGTGGSYAAIPPDGPNNNLWLWLGIGGAVVALVLAMFLIKK